MTIETPAGATAAVAQAKTNSLVTKLWNYCTVLRDDGLSTIDYVEQLSYLLFLKIADEQYQNDLADVPKRLVAEHLDWSSLVAKKGEELERHYRHVLIELAKNPHTNLGTIFAKAQNRITDPAKLQKLAVDLIGKQDWAAAGVDIKGDAYEGLLAKGAEDIKTGAGQYFTPRPLIDAIVEVTRPTPDDTILDPACGTGGFLIAAHAHIAREYQGRMTKAQQDHLSSGAIRGVELVPGTARLAAMNMILHGVGTSDGPSLIDVRDALAKQPGGDERVSLVLANPPFGKKSSITVYGSDGRLDKEDISYDRTDFRSTTTNKQLNFLQHIMSVLKIGGRAAVVLPDNVLFDGGAGEAIRRRLLKEFDVHTLLRLPKGIFYAGGVRANVLFFDKKSPRTDNQPWTSKLWVYDFRVGEHFTLKTRPMRRAHLDDFVAAYLPGKPRSERVESERFKVFEVEKLLKRDKMNLDITWLKDPALDDADSLLPSAVIAREIVDDLQAALNEFAAIAEALGEPVADEIEADAGSPL
ncbi:class I SAM-dependent DNA methyltransferase [Streptosporangium sp. NBC_01469]|uniref:class I SAM-dependent DNA methyltransferase n=1 Tax=Streptosporangium sp. NBC_01469 TaxID=2903898 RepID=UPI002E28627A|nr:class I SAM-dependent DNA methyltransferase [Streptosporangium sp. NBC_01469]